LTSNIPRPQGGLYFSCLARGEHLFGSRGAELEVIRRALGEVPLVGFFCNGEISRDRLYGYTGVLTLFQ
jgi:small ligand-binding sensory domain FIST